MSEEQMKWCAEMLSKSIEQDKEISRLYYVIKKAKGYIQRNCILSDKWTDLGFCNFTPTGRIKYKQLTPKKVEELLKILDQGSDI